MPWDWPSAEVLHRPEAQLQRFVSGVDSVVRVFFGMAKKWGGTNEWTHMGMDQYLLIPFLGG